MSSAKREVSCMLDTSLEEVAERDEGAFEEEGGSPLLLLESLSLLLSLLLLLLSLWSREEREEM